MTKLLILNEKGRRCLTCDNKVKGECVFCANCTNNCSFKKRFLALAKFTSKLKTYGDVE